MGIQICGNNVSLDLRMFVCGAKSVILINTSMIHALKRTKLSKTKHSLVVTLKLQ